MLKKTIRVLLMTVAVSGALVLAGCSDEIEGNEQSHPTYVKAKADRDAGKYKDAEAGLIDLLAKAPNSAFLHKELATLYGDCMNDHYRAIYHYTRYMELAKTLSPDDRKNILNFIAVHKTNAAKELIATDPKLVPSAPTVDPVMEQERLDLLDRATALADELTQVRNQYLELQARYKALEKRVTAPAAQRPAAAPAAQRSAAAPAAAPAAASGDYIEYTVQPNDNLTKIAKRHGVTLSEMMRANGMTKETAGNIKIGQKLKVPKK